MPRATRDMPIAMPTGTAVTKASQKAAVTRSTLASRCSHSGLSLAVPVTYSWNCCHTACGLGRNSGLTQPMFVTRNHSANRVATLATLMATLEPSPGTLKALVFGAAGSGMRHLSRWASAGARWPALPRAAG